MTGQQFSWKFYAVIALKERNADGPNFFDRMYPQLPLRQWGAYNFYLLVLSSWKANIAKKIHSGNADVDKFGQGKGEETETTNSAPYI